MPPMIATQWLQDHFYGLMVNSEGCTESNVYWNLYTLKLKALTLTLVHVHDSISH